MVQLNKAYDEIRKLNGELLAIHVECSEAGTRTSVKRNNLTFPMANDDRLKVVDKYSPTSTYLIDKNGMVRARWFDAIHKRVGPEEIISALMQIQDASRETPNQSKNKQLNRE